MRICRLRPMAVGVVLLVSVGLGLQCAGHRQRPTMTIALFPFINFTEAPEASDVIMPLYEEALRKKGFALITGEPMEEFLWRHRIRRTDMVGLRTVNWLADELKVQGVMMGMIHQYRSGVVPQIGLTARLVAVPEASILWAQDSALSGDDFTGPLGIGTVRKAEKLAPRVVSRLLSSLRAVPAVQLAQPPDVPAFYDNPLAQPPSPVIYLNPRSDFYGLDSIGIVPFNNQSKRRGAGDIISALFVTQLHNTGRFRVIEPGLVREQFLRFRVRARGEIDRLGLRPLNRNIRAQAYITGTVERYDEGIIGRVQSPPEVAISARLLRAQDDKIVWAMQNRHRGDDFNLLLDFGRVYSIIPLARLTVAEMVSTFTSP